MMADFEPLQSDDEAEVLGEFGVQEKRKKDSVGKFNLLKIYNHGTKCQKAV